jgi:hypothetical protein
MNGSQRDYYQAMEGGGNAGERVADSLVGEKFTIFPKVELNWLF